MSVGRIEADGNGSPGSPSIDHGPSPPAADHLRPPDRRRTAEAALTAVVQALFEVAEPPDGPMYILAGAPVRVIGCRVRREDRYGTA